MATTVKPGQMTLMDEARRLDPDGKVARIAELMTKRNEILQDAVYLEGNLKTGHTTTMRTGIPTVAWRQINQGVQPAKSTTKQISFTAGHLEGLGQVDEMLVKLSKDPQGLRLSENAPYIESIAQTLATTMFYGDVTIYPDRFTGLTKYYSSTTADSGGNVILGGGSDTDNTSVWLVCWGDQTTHCFYPQGSKAGIEHNDLGKMLIEDGITTGSKYMAYVDQYMADCGLAVRDWRFNVRICNLDVSALATAGASADSSATLMRFMIQAVNKLPNLNMGRLAWYCNKEVKTALDIQAFNKTNLQLSISEVEGFGPVTKFMGIPVRRCDAILNNESLVS